MQLYKALAISSGIAVILAASPFISAFAASAIAEAYGCTISAGVDETCVVAGSDMRDVLFNMGMAIWFFIFSFLYVPVAITLAVAAVVIWLRDRSGKYPIRRVGLLFWLLSFAALLIPFITKFSLLLIALAGGHIVWRQRKIARRTKIGHRDTETGVELSAIGRTDMSEMN